MLSSAHAEPEFALKIRTTLIAASLLAATSAQAAILDEGFETYSVSAVFDTFTTALGSTWTVGGNSVDVVRVGGTWEGSGNYTLDLNGDDTGSITTALSGLVSGQEYQVSFLYGGNMQASGSGSRAFTVTAGGSASSFDNPSQSLQSGALVFVAGAATNPLTFASLVTGNAGAVIDDITVAAIPEPHEWAMMLAGLGLVSWAARRRRETAGRHSAVAAA